jgi:hypothetical protein
MVEAPHRAAGRARVLTAGELAACELHGNEGIEVDVCLDRDRCEVVLVAGSWHLDGPFDAARERVAVTLGPGSTGVTEEEPTNPMTNVRVQ